MGLLEIIDVSASRSRGQIIYATEPVQQQHVAQEVPYNTRGIMGFRLQTLRYQLADGEVTGVAPLLEFVYATDRPFGNQWGLSLGFSTLLEMLFINIGLERSLELPILPGHFYITAGSGEGLYGLSRIIHTGPPALPVPAQTHPKRGQMKLIPELLESRIPPNHVALFFL